MILSGSPENLSSRTGTRTNRQTIIRVTSFTPAHADRGTTAIDADPGNSGVSAEVETPGDARRFEDLAYATSELINGRERAQRAGSRRSLALRQPGANQVPGAANSRSHTRPKAALATIAAGTAGPSRA